jgi:hypothetical protein
MNILHDEYATLINEIYLKLNLTVELNIHSHGCILIFNMYDRLCFSIVNRGDGLETR